jgi:hypothetical protein
MRESMRESQWGMASALPPSFRSALFTLRRPAPQGDSHA